MALVQAAENHGNEAWPDIDGERSIHQLLTHKSR